MGYKTKSMLHLYSADREKTKENNKNTPAAKGSYSNPGSNLFPAYKPKVTAATSVGGSDAAQLGNVAAQLASKLIGSGAGRSTSNFDRKIEAKKEKGNLAGSARAERREAKWDYRQKKRAAKTLAKTEGTYLSKRKEKKRVEGLDAFDRETYDMEQSVKPTRSESIASELKENQLRRLNAAKEETKPEGDTGSSITNITNTGTGAFNPKTRFTLGGSLNNENWNKLVPPKPVFGKNINVKNPNVNVNDPGEGVPTPTKELTEPKPTKKPFSNLDFTLANAKIATQKENAEKKENPTQNEKDISRKYHELQLRKAEQKVGAGERDDSYDKVKERQDIEQKYNESNERIFGKKFPLPTIN